MAKLSLEIDTEAKIVKVMLNGVTLSDIDSISVYKNYCDNEEYYIRATTRKKSEDGVAVITDYIMDCENDEKATASEIPGFKSKPTQSQAQVDISNFLRNHLNVKRG